MKVDMSLCERFIATLKKQEIGFDGDKVVALTPHWLSQMVTEAVDGADKSCEVLASFVKSNMPLIQAYATSICDRYGEGTITKELFDLFIQEVAVIFAYRVIEFAHNEEIEGLKKEIKRLKKKIKEEKE